MTAKIIDLRRVRAYRAGFANALTGNAAAARDELAKFRAQLGVPNATVFEIEDALRRRTDRDGESPPAA